MTDRRQRFLDALAMVEALRESAKDSPPPVIQRAWKRALELRDSFALEWLVEVGPPAE